MRRNQKVSPGNGKDGRIGGNRHEIGVVKSDSIASALGDVSASARQKRAAYRSRAISAGVARYCWALDDQPLAAARRRCSASARQLHGVRAAAGGIYLPCSNAASLSATE